LNILKEATSVANLEKLGKVIDADVLIIGGGASGLWSALRAREFIDKVLVVDKGPRDWGGLASMAGGDFDAVLPGESVEQWIEDLVYYYDGLCQQDLMEEVFKQTYDRFKDYERFGAQFFTLPDGQYKSVPQRGLNHVKLYPAKYKGKGGEDMMRGLVHEVDRLGVERWGRTLITDLLKRDGRVVGAVGFDTMSGRFCIFKARAVILATGAGGWKTSYHQNTMTGEGIHMAFRNGAEMRNFEFGKVWNVPKLFAWESQTTLLPLGARFVNAKGESFMDKYCPTLGANTDPHYNVIGMAFESREGKGPIYFDISELRTTDITKPQTGWQLMNYQKLVALGIDLFTQNTEWMPQLQGSFAGLVADLEGNTGVPGLFVAGRGRSLDPGVYIGGFALATTAVTGYITGKVAAEHARSNEPLLPDESEVAEYKKQLFAPVGESGIAPKEVLREIQETIFPYDVSIIKSEASLTRALAKIDRVENELLPQSTAKDAHYLMKLIEVKAIAWLSELYLRASLMREETRAGHYREDYPDRDNANWLKWIVFSQKDGKLNVRTEPVPFDRYKIKPTRYYMDQFRFPREKS
jgi:succinate dehydrogenase/fumarate reductase flavoprotein subunit